MYHKLIAIYHLVEFGKPCKNVENKI